MNYTLLELQEVIIRPSIMMFNTTYGTKVPLTTLDLRTAGYDTTTGEVRYFIDCFISSDIILRIYIHLDKMATSQIPVPDPYHANNSVKLFIHMATVPGVDMLKAIRVIQGHILGLGGDLQQINKGQVATLDSGMLVTFLVDSSNNIFADHTGASIILNT